MHVSLILARVHIIIRSVFLRKKSVCMCYPLKANCNKILDLIRSVIAVKIYTVASVQTFMFYIQVGASQKASKNIRF